MVLGIDIGGTNTEFAVVDATKGIINIQKIKTKSHNSFLNYIENFTDIVKELTKKFNISDIGIGAPNFDSGSNTFCPVNFNWSDVSPFNLEQHLENEVSIRTSIVNDANCWVCIFLSSKRTIVPGGTCLIFRNGESELFVSKKR